MKREGWGDRIRNVPEPVQVNALNASMAVHQHRTMGESTNNIIIKLKKLKYPYNNIWSKKKKGRGMG